MKKSKFRYIEFGFFPYFRKKSIVLRSIVFRNFDRYGIKNLLKEIGEHTLRQECELKFYSFPKRLGNFHIEANDHCTFLVYRYNDGEKKVMKLDRYELPETGWVRVKLRQ